MQRASKTVMFFCYRKEIIWGTEQAEMDIQKVNIGLVLGLYLALIFLSS